MRLPYRYHVIPCSGPHCGEEKGEALKGLLKDLVPDRKKLGVRMSTSSCQGMCKRGPNICVYPEGVVYHQVDESDIERIVKEHLVGGVPVEEILQRSLDEIPLDDESK